MAEVEVPIALALTTSPQTAYTVPTGKRAVILSAQVTNISTTGNALVATVQRAAAGGAGTWPYSHEVEVSKADNAVSVVSGGQPLAAGDQLQAYASADGYGVLTGGVLEIDV